MDRIERLRKIVNRSDVLKELEDEVLEEFEDLQRRYFISTMMNSVAADKIVNLRERLKKTLEENKRLEWSERIVHDIKMRAISEIQKQSRLTPKVTDLDISIATVIVESEEAAEVVLYCHVVGNEVAT